ncbi:tetratricopeptide repeat protein [Bernardetia litoralis DSM 6794]|uniref:Tetratricopeptide repeat protein n=1 Tax=Bernardetia litoralis (strain ATCC 23117 / DSM 6794 / NBRC 15988 / NCIMB 1366 / Fx l1 / Sio-4) TaxID=880071 RepID=I4ALE8_BERLS|nr:tetratricopeptide repeat protein [Bernardetia litoralis]AFM04783.1 tetratricopeptide repeat protein [Bernardetia litoralis DSM 6794]
MTNSILKSIFAGAAFVAGSLLTNIAVAQNGAVNTAEFYIKPETAKYEKALEKIRQATYHEKTKDKAKTWYIRAKVFITIFEVGTEDKKVAALVSNPVDSAFLSMQKAKELEKGSKKDTYTKRIEDPAFQTEVGMETGLEQRIKNDLLAEVVKYQDTEFEKAYEVMIPIVTYLPADTTNLTYISYFASKAEKLKEAAIYSEKLGDVEEYTGNVEAYQSAAYSYYKLEDSVNFLRILEKGAKRFPKETYFLTNIADVHIKAKDYPKAIEILKKVVEIEPTAKVLTNIAIMYQGEEQPEKAVEYYKKVLELDAQDYDATFALALHYYRQAANELEGNDQAATSPKMKMVIENADQSIIYAKKAMEINNDDDALYSMLKDLYVMKEDSKNVELMKKKIADRK